MAQGILPIDADGLKALGAATYKVVSTQMKSSGVPDWFIPYIAGLVTGVGMLFPCLFAIFANGVTAVGGFFAVQFLGVVDEMKRNNAGDFNNVLAAAANELLGTDISGSQLTGGSGSGSTMDQNLVIGRSLLGIFEQGFGGDGALTPEQGADNAKKFAGFAINFGMSQGFLSILTEATSIGLLKEFHELPEALKGALGIGRLQRLALQPLLQNAVQKPYARYCMAKYRPTKLVEAQLVKALHSGQMADADVRQALAELGYSDDLINFVLTDFQTRMSLSELVLLLNNGDIQEQDVINNLTLSGMPEDQAKLQLQASDLAAAKTQVDALLAEIEKAYVGGFIDQGTYNAMLQKLPLSGEQEQAFRAKVGFLQETPRAKVSFADVKTALVDNIVDFSYLDTWFATSGYDSQSQLILTFQVLEAIKKAEQKVEFAKYRAQVLRAANKPVPPWITAAESTT